MYSSLLIRMPLSLCISEVDFGTPGDFSMVERFILMNARPTFNQPEGTIIPKPFVLAFVPGEKPNSMVA
jgi:hypothetical protein